MKKINKKGFTLIELLAVIVIMGVLLLAAIPAVSRVIENSRRDTFKNTAQQYVSAIKTEVLNDSLVCGSSPISSVGNGTYYYYFDSADSTGKDLMEQGGKSAWGNANVKGYVKIEKTVVNNKATYKYYVQMVDTAGHRGIGGSASVADVEESVLSRTDVATSGRDPSSPVTDTSKKCTLQK